MLIEHWNNIPQLWRTVAYKAWLLFIEHKFPLNIYFGDDSYGIDFLLCKALKIESANPEIDLSCLTSIIEDGIREISIETLDAIFSMQFLPIPSEITDLSPIRYFPNIKVLDFHCANYSSITDFSELSNRDMVYILDYADYSIIDFEKNSNICEFDNIVYIKGYGIPSELKKIYSVLKPYRIDE